MSTKAEADILEKPIEVPNYKLAIDIICIALTIGIGIALWKYLRTNTNSYNFQMILLLLPAFLLALSIKGLVCHLGAKRIILHEYGIEIKRCHSEIIDWRFVSNIMEKRTYSGGLKVILKSGKSHVIPVGAKNYKSIREFLFHRVKM